MASSPMESFIFLIWIAVWGIIPPVIVYYCGYLQGRKGYKEVVASRDAAMKRLDDVENLLKSFKPVVEVPDEVVRKLTKSILAAIKASWGQVLTEGRKAGDEAVGHEVQEILDNMDPEMVEKARSSRITDAIMNRLMDFIAPKGD